MKSQSAPSAHEHSSCKNLEFSNKGEMLTNLGQIFAEQHDPQTKKKRI